MVESRTDGKSYSKIQGSLDDVKVPEGGSRGSTLNVLLNVL